MSRKDIELFAWGSRSRSRVFTPLLARAAARLIAVVVLPTPPFWFAIAMIMSGLECRRWLESGSRRQRSAALRRHERCRRADIEGKAQRKRELQDGTSYIVHLPSSSGLISSSHFFSFSSSFA